MYRVGELVRWRKPLEAEYSYGTIAEIEGRNAVIIDSGYYAGQLTRVYFKHIEKVKKGGVGYGRSKKYRKHTATKAKLQRA